ncbi:MAG: retention module-containing protein, partial [Betaproteobacteria bacterium]
MAATGKVLGTVTSVVGEVKAIAADGTVRILQVGDEIHADETLNTGTLGSINIVMANGATLDCGANTDLPLHEGLLGVAAAVAAAPAITAPAGDVAALQAAIAAGQDPSQVAQATAAGGAPAAGGVDSGGAHSPVILEQTNSASVVSSGFQTEGAGIGFPSPEFLLLGGVEQQPTVSVGVDVSVEPGEGGGGTDPGIVVSGNTASLIEGTNGADGKLVTFVISLSQAFDEPVTVTYQVMPGTAQTPSDYFDGETLSGTVTLEPGTTQFFVLVQITQDHLVEANETFNIVLTEAINATIDPNADEVIVTIVDDDLNPIARDDAYSVNEGQTLTGNVLTKVDAGETDDDTAQGVETLQVITAGTFATAEGGTVVLAADGSFTYTPPSENYNGPDSFEYTIREMSGGELINDPDTATVTINVLAVNDPPVAEGEAFTTAEDTALTGSVTGNESDIEDGTNLTYVLVSGPSNSEAFTLNADGSFSYMPTDNYNGPDSFTYKVVDSDGLESNVVTADITVTPVNDPPVITPVDVEGLVNESGLPTEDRSVDSDKLTTGGSFAVSDVDGDTITLSQIQFKPSGAEGFTTVTASGSSAEVDTGHGILSLNSTDGGQNWAWTYELYAPVTDGTGNEVDEFKVTVTDGTAQVSSDIIATVTIVDDLPAAVNDVGGADEDQTVVVNVLANDLVGADVNGTLVSATLATSGAGSISFDANGNVTFDPAPGFQGPVTINYTMQDVDGDQSNAVLTITVSPDSEPTVDVVLAEGDDGASDESALAGGTGGGSTMTSGTFPIDTGNDAVASLTVDGVNVTNGGTVTTGDYGTLVVTLAD